LRFHPHKVPGQSRPHPHRKPWPIALVVKTVPALAGVSFTFDGHVLVTGSNGQATYTAEHDFAKHKLSVVDVSVSLPAHRYKFSRWGGQRDPNQAFRRTVTGLPLRANYAVTAAFTLQQPLQPRLVQQDGSPVDPAEVSTITVKSKAGQIVTLSSSAPTWLDVSLPAYRHGTLSAAGVRYSLQSVIVRGSNVVDAGRQVFTPASNPTFVTQFHDLTVTGHDALFSSPRGSAAVVTFPDGGKLSAPFDARHKAVFNNLPRGNYRVDIKAGTAIVASDQFTLSRDKTADLAVISLLDMSLLGGLCLVLAIGLLVVGRKHWRNWLVRTLRRALRNRSKQPLSPEKVMT
jgi:hypothetical protein